MLVATLLLVCLLSAFVSRQTRTDSEAFLFGLLASSAICALGFVIGLPRLVNDPLITGYGFWYVDTFAGLMIILISLVQWTAVMASISSLWQEEEGMVVDLTQIRRYFSEFFLFVAAIILAVVANNLIISMIALGASILAMTPLINFYGTAESERAARRYRMFCSIGILVALVGLVMIVLSAHAGGISGLAGSDWAMIIYKTANLSPDLVRLAFILILLGFGINLGLVPLHLWVPEAHAEAPAPIAGVLSGVFLSTVLYSLMRYKLLLDTTLTSSTWSNETFMIVGALSCLTAASLLFFQKEYKRFLAFTSVQNIGLMVFSAAFGAWGAIALIIHMFAHALIKSALFFVSSDITWRFKTGLFAGIRGVVRALPFTGWISVIAILFMSAVPSSPILFSEYNLAKVVYLEYPVAFWLIALAALALLVRSLLVVKVFVSKVEARVPAIGERWNFAHTGAVVHLLILVLCSYLLYSGFLVEPIVRIIGFIR